MSAQMALQLVDPARAAGSLLGSAKCMRSIHRRAESAREVNTQRKQAEMEEALKKQETAKLGFKVRNHRVTIHSLEKTDRGKMIEGVSAIMGATARAKHATEKKQVSKRDVQEFLAGSSKHAAEDEEVGLTWVAAATTAVHGAPVQEKLSDQEIKETHSALQTTAAVRTQSQRALIRRVLSSVHLFSKLSFKEICALADVVGVDEFMDGDVIMTEGEPGEEFCIILTGKVDIIIGGRHARRAKTRQRAKTIASVAGTLPKKKLTRGASFMTMSGDRSSHSDQSVPTRPHRRNVKNDTSRIPKSAMSKEELREWDGVTVGRMQDGATFGELALLDSMGVRTATAVAVGPTIIVTVGRRDFNNLVAKLIQDKTQARLNVLQKNFAFASWSTDRLIKLSNFLVPFTFARNTVIAAENAEIKHVFLVSDGTVQLATDVQPNADSTNQMQHQVHDPERHRSRVQHPVHSPRPGRALMDFSVDGATVELANLGPNSIIGQVELAVGRGRYQGTYIASTEVKGFMMKASEFMNRLDATTFSAIRSISEEIVMSRCERVDNFSFRAQDRKVSMEVQRQQRQQQQHSRQSGGGKSDALKLRTVRPDSAPSSWTQSVAGPPTPRWGTLGLHISLGLSRGVVAFPIDPTEARMRDRQRSAKFPVPTPPNFRKDTSPRKGRDVADTRRIAAQNHARSHSMSAEAAHSMSPLSDAARLKARMKRMPSPSCA